MNKKNKVRMAEAGVGIAAAAAVAAAAAYWFSGTEGKKRQAKVKMWTAKAQKEIVKKMKVARTLGEAEYNRIVDHAVKQYGSLENVSASDIMQAGKKLKAEWQRIQSNARKRGAPSKKRTPTKKAAKRKPGAKGRKGATK